MVNFLKIIYRKIRIILKTILFKISIKKHNNIFLFGTPDHTNLGDQAQTYCIVNWLKKNYSGYKIHTFTSWELTNKNSKILEIIKKRIKNGDKIFFQSGYHITDLYINEELMHRKVISLFSDRKIVILPQTVNFLSAEEKEKTKKIYNSNKNIILFARDEISYNISKEMFYNLKVYLFPDIVTTLIGTKKFSGDRDGILFCIRNDKEALYTKEQLENLKFKLAGSTGRKIDFTDTTLNVNLRKLIKNRGKFINEYVENLSRYKLIITDRYHGLIFSMIAATPVIVISSTDHKLSSGVKWFPKEFDDYIKYASDDKEIIEYAKTILDKNDYDYSLPQYFNQNYYSKLKNIIEG